MVSETNGIELTELTTEPEAPPTAQELSALPADKVLTVMSLDLAVHMLAGQADQLLRIRQHGPAQFLASVAEDIAKWRDRYVKRAASSIVVIGADGAAKP